MDGWASIGLVVAGGGVGLVGSYLQRRWTRADSRSTRIEDRASEAAAQIMELLASALAARRQAYNLKTSSEDAIHAVCNQIERHAILLPNKELRRWVSKLTLVLWHTDLLESQPVGETVSVVYVVFAAGQQLLGAFQRGEALPADTQKLSKAEELWQEAVEFEKLVEEKTHRPTMMADDE